MWIQEYIEFAVTAAGGNFTRTQAAGHWAEWIKTLGKIADTAGPGPEPD